MIEGKTIAFIGLGRMGYRMASNLRKKISPSAVMLVSDLNSDSCHQFVQEHVNFGPTKYVSTAREAARCANVIISMVTAAPAVRAVYLDPDTGVIQAPPDPERLILECSTIDLVTTREVEAEVRKARVGTYIDCPVSGGPPRAEDGSLSFMIGHAGLCSGDNLGPRILEVVETMGKRERIIFCGGFSTGLAAKIANNYVACTNMVTLAEGFAMALANGVDRKTMYEVLHHSSGASFVLEHVQPVPGVVPGSASNDYQVAFLMPMIIKDMRLGCDMANAVNTPSNNGKATLKTYEGANNDPRCQNRDCTSVWLHITDCRFDPKFQKPKRTVDDLGL